MIIIKPKQIVTEISIENSRKSINIIYPTAKGT